MTDEPEQLTLEMFTDALAEAKANGWEITHFHISDEGYAQLQQSPELLQHVRYIPMGKHQQLICTIFDIQLGYGESIYRPQRLFQWGYLDPLFGMRLPEGSNNEWEALTEDERKALKSAVNGLAVAVAQHPQIWNIIRELKYRGYINTAYDTCDPDSTFLYYLTWRGFRIIPVNEVEGEATE